MKTKLEELPGKKGAKRRHMKKSEFGIPGKRRFPMEDAKHARLAIGGATRSYRAGNISKGTEERIKSEARKKLGEGGGDMRHERSRHRERMHRLMREKL